MPIADVGQDNGSIQGFNVDVIVGAIQCADRGVAALYGDVPAKFFYVDRTGFRLQGNVRICRNLDFIFHNAAGGIGSGKKMRDQADAISALALIEFDFVGMKNRGHQLPREKRRPAP